MASVKPNYSKDDKNNIISYKVTIYLGRDKNGKNIREYYTFPVPTDTPKKQRLDKVRADAFKLEEKRKKEYVADTAPLCSRNIGFQDFVENIFLKTKNANDNLASTTRDYYRYNSMRAVRYFENTKLSSIHTIDVNDYLLFLQLADEQEKKLSAKTIAHHRAVLRAIFTYARSIKIVDENPVDDAIEISTRKQAIKSLSSEEAKELLQIVEAKTDVKHQCICKFLLYYGIRRGELCGLQWKDIDFDNMKFRIERNVSFSSSGGLKVGYTKTDEAQRPLTLCDDLIQSLKQLREEQIHFFAPLAINEDCYLFSFEKDPRVPMSPQSITSWFNRFSEANHLSHIYPHLLRHTVATLMKSNGASDDAIQNTLGHTDFRTTRDYYIAKDANRFRNEANAYIQTLKK